MADIAVSGSKQLTTATVAASSDKPALESVTVKSFAIPVGSGARFKAISDAIHGAGLVPPGNDNYAWPRGLRQEGSNFVALVHVGVFAENACNEDPHYVVTVSSNNVASNVREVKVVG